MKNYASNPNKAFDYFSKSLLAFYFQSSTDNNEFNTKDLENQISNLLKNHLIELNTEHKANSANNKTHNSNNYWLSSMQLVEGGFYGKKLNADNNSHSMVIALDIISEDEKILRNLASKQTNSKSTNNNNNNMKARILNYDENYASKDNKSKDELKLLFNVKFDYTKKSFLVEKINFNIDKNIQINLPNEYEDMLKINENDHFVFYIAKKFGIKCSGDLFVANKDRNLWTLAKKNLVLSQRNLVDSISNEFIADFINVKLI